jgi:predicted AlkP superfamily phosphohydrolase/phosphomutase
MNKAIVIGLDGGTFDILGPLADQGLLPNIKNLMDSGVWGRLRTVIPPGTGPAWSSIVTGLDPSSHGVFDLIVRADDSYNLAFLNASSLRAPAVWDIVGAFDGKVLVLNVPMTYPPRKVNGYMVSGLLTPLGSSDCTYPPDLLANLKRIAPTYQIVPTQAYSPGRIAKYLDQLEAVIEAKAEVLERLIAEHDWQFVMQVFNETDFLQHALWHVIDTEHPRHNQRDYRRYRDRIFGIYRRIDTLIGKILETVSEDTTIVILSDHGHGPLHEFIHANNLLLEAGVMNVKRGIRSRLKYLMFKAGLTPLNVYKAGNALGLARLRMGLRWTSKGYEMLRRLFFSFSDIDWQRTEAYAISGGVYGGLFINLAGREPTGMVGGDRYEEVMNRLEQVLRDMTHPGRGDRLVSDVLRREQVYKGRFADESPDMFFLPSRPTMAVFGDFEFSSNRVVETASESISAQHRMEGVFVARGPGMRQGVEVDGMEVVDIAPLLLYAMELPIPEGLDGTLQRTLFVKDAFDRRPPAYCKAEELPGGAEGGRRSSEDESIRDRLKGLGYIS